MEKYLLGYKQGNGEYVYLASINKNNISVTLNTEDALDFINDTNAINMCEYVNSRDGLNTYVPLIVTTTISTLIDEEVVDNGTITNE